MCVTQKLRSRAPSAVEGTPCLLDWIAYKHTYIDRYRCVKAPIMSRQMGLETFSIVGHD